MRPHMPVAVGLGRSVPSQPGSVASGPCHLPHLPWAWGGGRSSGRPVPYPAASASWIWRAGPTRHHAQPSIRDHPARDVPWKRYPTDAAIHPTERRGWARAPGHGRGRPGWSRRRSL